MGVYIKGATLQQFERDAAVFLVHKDGRAYQLTYYDEKPFEVVEVKEPHGRLIDIDALMKKHDMAQACDECPTNTWKCTNSQIRYDKDVVCNWIDSAPTVIEREGE